jgi:cytochrome c oxidase cbb3-type subunit IV
MDLNDVRTLWTTLSFLAFVGIIIWAFSGKRKRQFEEAARLALDDEPDSVNKSSSGQGRVA